MDKDFDKFVMKEFPQSSYYKEELCDWVFDDLVPLDSLLGSLVMKYDKGLSIKEEDISILKQDLTELKSKLKNIHHILDKRDLAGYSYNIEYLNTMSKVAETIEEFNPKDDAELYAHLSRARARADRIRTSGFDGKSPDYDLCVTNNCLGGNSNTLQANIWKAMGRTFTVPAGVFLPGINGKFYDGPTDDVMRKLGKQLQDNDL